MQDKRSKKELTRLILMALILGGGSLYGPIAEAETVTVTVAPDNIPSGSGLTKSSDIVYANNSSTQWKLNYGAGDAWNNYSIFGGYITSTNLSDFTITLANSGSGTINKLMGAHGGDSASNATNVWSNKVYMTGGNAKIVIGGYSYKGSAGKSNDSTKGNTVTINGGTVGGLIDTDISNETTGVIGGCAGLGENSNNSAGAFYNQVTISPTADTSITGNVYGGYSGHNNANNNEVTIENPNSKSLTFTNSTIYGGVAKKSGQSAIDNIININTGVSVAGIVGGDATNSSGNVLNIGATGITVGASGISKTQTIYIGYTGHSVAFADTTTPVLSSTGAITDVDTLDITGMTIDSNKYGTMTLVSASNSLAYMKLKYSTAAAATLPTAGVKVNSDTNTYSSTANNIKFDYTYDHILKWANADKKAIQYNIANNVSNVTPNGSIAWSNGGTVRALTDTTYTFGSGTAIDMSNLTFTGTVTTNPINQSMTLLSGATGITGGSITQPATGKGTVAANFTDTAGINFVGTAKGTVSVGTGDNAGKVLYTLNSGTLSTINLGGWTGATSDMSTGWTKATGGISVSGVFTKPTLAAGASKDIVTTNTADFFSDATIADDIKYKTGDSFSDTVAGVTLAGNKAGGVKATNSGKNLTYFGEMNDVNSVSLGTMTWGTPRAATAAYDFSGVTNIDASGLTFTGTATLTSLNDSTNLLTGATGLTSDTITQPTNKTFDIAYTDNTTKITYKGQATDGSVSRDGTNLKYTISAGTVNEIDLGQWNGTAAPNLPGTWNTPAGGVAVDTGDFDNPGGTGNVDIYTTDTEGFFNEENITGDKKYKDNEQMPDDEEDGITISGTKSGGIAPSNDGSTPTTSGKRLTYFAESTTGSKISLGEVAWNKAGTARTLTGNYDFSGLGANDVDATELTFTFANSGDATSANKIAKDDTMILLSGATNLAGNLNVNGSPVSQDVSCTIGNGIGLSGTLTGEVTTTTGNVNYKVTDKTLDSVNLSAWNGSNETLDTSWNKNASGINVTGSGFAAPTTIGDTPILTATNGFFTDAIIADNIKYQPSGSYSEVDQNITLSGSRGSGVKANDSGNQLVYSIGAAFINNIKLGAVTYTKNGIWIDKNDTTKYNFSTLSSLDTTGFSMSMTDDQKKTAAVNDTMTLVKGTTDLPNITAKDAGSSNYTYAATNGLTVGGTVSGSVSASNHDVLYKVTGNKATTLNITNVTWGQTYNRDNAELDYQPAVVDSSNILFTGVSNLSTGDVMTLVSNYGSGITKTRGGIFTLENGKTGKGTAYYEGGVLKYKVTLGAGEIQPAVSATNNKAILIIPGGQEHQGTVTGGEAKGEGDSTDNEQGVKGKIITNTDGTGGDVNGGTSEEGDSRRNKADVEDSNIAGDVNGGKSENGNSTDNEAEVDNSNVGGDVNGGKTDGDGETKGNEANVKNGSKVTGTVTGGRSGGNGDCTGNAAEVEGSEVGGDVNGGQSDGNGNTRENKTHVKDSKVTGNVNGGHSGQNDGSGGNGESTGNTAEVEGSEVGGNVNGGRSEQGNANKNESTVSGGSKVTGDVTGGSSGGTGNANENKTTVEGGSEIGGNVIGGQSNGGNTNKNETTVSGSTVNKDVIGGKTNGNGTSSENKTHVDGSNVGGSVIGGQSQNGDANKNETSVTGGSTVGGDVIGGKTTGTGNANENNVNIDGGSTVNGNVYGGYSATGDASGNGIDIGNGKVSGDIYGGFSGGSGSTINNTITLHGGADVSNSNIIGGNNGTAGNTLNIGNSNEPWTGGGQSVKNIAGFQTLNYTNFAWNSSTPGLTISDGTSSDLSGTTIAAKQVAFTGIKTLNTGATMTLLDQSNVAADKRATNVNAGSEFTVGTATEGTGKLVLDANGNVVYQVESAGASRQTHNTVMAAEAAVVALNAGNDFILSAREGLARKENIGKDGIAVFAQIGGGATRQETGSHVNVNMWNGIVAVGRKNVQKESTTEYGVFVEHGWGNFSTHSDNAHRGDGSVDYTGGGLLGKWTKADGLYVEGSLRIGSMHEKANNLLRDTVRGYGYDERTTYKGFHLGVGKEFAIKDGNTVEVYGKYFYNRKDGMNFNAGLDEYNLDAVTSQILRVGARYTMKRERWNYYGDLSYEHELDGKAAGRANGMAIRGADTSGGSVRLALGAKLLANEKSPWTLDLNLTGYAGKKQGLQGGVSVKFMF